MGRIKDKLDDKNIELTKILHVIKQSLDIYKLIGFNVSKIKKKGIGAKFFAMTQRLAIETYVIGICKIYEEEKRYELNSIPGIIQYIQNNNLNPENVHPIAEFAKKYEKKDSQKNDCIEKIKDIVNEFRSENDKDFKLCKQFRDKKLVHAEDISELSNTLPAPEVMERLLFFAIDFSSMTLEVFFGGVPVDHKDDKRVFGSLNSLLKKIGHENIKVDYDD